MTQNSLCGCFQSWLKIRMAWEFHRKYADPWALPPGMIFQWSLGGCWGVCSTALSEKQHPSEHLWRHFFQPSGEALSTKQWVCFVLMDDMNLLNGFFSFSFQFPGNSDPIYVQPARLSTNVLSLVSSLYTSSTSCLWFYSAFFILKKMVKFMWF